MAGETLSEAESFENDLLALGYRLVQDRGTGMLRYSAQASPYLTYWVHWNTGERTVLFTWELAIGEYFSANAMQIGANEELNQFLFPKRDARGAQDIAFVAAEMDRVERILAGVNLLAGTEDG
jgi:hypothetical protein